MDWFTYFLVFLKASLLSTGGRGPLPYLYSDLIAHGWALDSNFVEALTVGELSPGPSGLWVVSLGYLTGGMPGALLATAAVTIPPLLVLLVARVHARLKAFPATRGALNGLTLAIVGSGLVIVVNLFVRNGVDVVTVSICAVCLLLALWGRIPSLVLLIGAAIAGIALLPA